MRDKGVIDLEAGSSEMQPVHIFDNYGLPKDAPKVPANAESLAKIDNCAVLADYGVIINDRQDRPQINLSSNNDEELLEQRRPE